MDHPSHFQDKICNFKAQAAPIRSELACLSHLAVFVVLLTLVLSNLHYHDHSLFLLTSALPDLPDHQYLPPLLAMALKTQRRWHSSRSWSLSSSTSLVYSATSLLPVLSMDSERRSSCISYPLFGVSL